MYGSVAADLSIPRLILYNASWQPWKVGDTYRVSAGGFFDLLLSFITRLGLTTYEPLLRSNRINVPNLRQVARGQGGYWKHTVEDIRESKIVCQVARRHELPAYIVMNYMQ